MHCSKAEHLKVLASWGKRNFAHSRRRLPPLLACNYNQHFACECVAAFLFSCLLVAMSSEDALGKGKAKLRGRLLEPPALSCQLVGLENRSISSLAPSKNVMNL